MKKLRNIAVIILLISLSLYLFVLNEESKIESKARDFSGIAKLKTVEIVTKGATQVPPSRYYVFKVSNISHLDEIKKSYRLTEPSQTEETNSTFVYPTTKYMDYNRSFFVKNSIEDNGDFLKTRIQDDLVIFTLFYTN